MPFSTYLKDVPETHLHNLEHQSTDSSFLSPYDPVTEPEAQSFASTFDHHVHVQIPHILYSSAPSLAPGGGAEVLPLGLHYQANNPWLASAHPSLHHPYVNTPSVPKHQQFQDDASPEIQPAYRTSNPSVYPPEPVSPEDLSMYLHPVLAQQLQQRHLQQQQQRQQQQQQQHQQQEQQHMQDQPPRGEPGSAQQAQTMTQTQISQASSHSPSSQDLVSGGASSNMPSAHEPSQNTIPIYSTTGFDILSLLGRVANRPNPQISLGPVDLTCSFVVVDARGFDHPIIYCSPTFCQLTGYEEREIIGRNCRFLQSPDGQVTRGEARRYTSSEAVTHIQQQLAAGKECQTSIVNYKKGGDAFINLVSVIPVPADAHSEEIAYLIGFQVDLNEQPSSILQRIQEGTYASSGNPQNALNMLNGPGFFSRDRKPPSTQPIAMSKELEQILEDPAFLRSIPITTAGTFSSAVVPPLTTVSSPSSTSLADASYEAGHRLHLILLEALPDFVLVVSLKGTFLYVGPSIRRVLGYDSEELVGKSISDFAHPEDVVPLMRELKESSATGPSAAAASAVPTTTSSIAMLSTSQNSNLPLSSDVSHASSFNLFPLSLHTAPRNVDLLFRAKTKSGVYVWVECRGRLHVEPGKGRKAIILTARAKMMPYLEWKTIADAGGVTLPSKQMICDVDASHSSSDTTIDHGGGVQSDDGGGESITPRTRLVDREFWGTFSPEARILAVRGELSTVLGWKSEDLIGRGVETLLAGEASVKTAVIEEIRKAASAGINSDPSQISPSKFVKLNLSFQQKESDVVNGELVLYPPSYTPSAGDPDALATAIATQALMRDRWVYKGPRLQGRCVGVGPPPVIFQIKLTDSLPEAKPLVHSLTEDVFEELGPNRSSSWQYEVQQLRNLNNRLLEEIHALEKGMQVSNQDSVPGETGEAGGFGQQTTDKGHGTNGPTSEEALRSREQPAGGPSPGVDPQFKHHSILPASFLSQQPPQPSLMFNQMQPPSIFGSNTAASHAALFYAQPPHAPVGGQEFSQENPAYLLQQQHLANQLGILSHSIPSQLPMSSTSSQASGSPVATQYGSPNLGYEQAHPPHSHPASHRYLPYRVISNPSTFHNSRSGPQATPQLANPSTSAQLQQPRSTSLKRTWGMTDP